MPMLNIDDMEPSPDVRAAYLCCPDVIVEATDKQRILINGVQVRLQDVPRVVRGLMLAMEHSEVMGEAKRAVAKGWRHG